MIIYGMSREDRGMRPRRPPAVSFDHRHATRSTKGWPPTNRVEQAEGPLPSGSLQHSESNPGSRP